MLPIPMQLSFREVEFFFLILVRTATMLMLVPLFGYTTNPAPVKIGFSILLAMILLPIVPIANFAQSTGLPGFVELIIKEVTVGLILGMLTLFLFVGVQFAGELIGMQMGFSMASMMDPTQETNLSLIGQVNFYIAMMLFLVMNGHHRWIEALYYSYQIVPPGAAKISIPHVMNEWIGLTSGVFVIAIKIAAPVMATLFLTDVALGLLSRSSEQLNIFSVGFGVKIFIGLFAIVSGIPLFAYAFGKIFAELMKKMEFFLSLLKV